MKIDRAAMIRRAFERREKKIVTAKIARNRSVFYSTILAAAKKRG